MISVNLLPVEFRKRKEIHFVGLPNKKVGKIVGGIFITLTAIFYVQFWINLATYKQLEKSWPVLQTDQARVFKLRSEIDKGSKNEKTFLDSYITSSYATTSLLTAVSETLPDSIWLVEMKFARNPNENALVLKGLSRVSKKHSSIQDIEKYLRDLKRRFPQGTSLILTTSRQSRENVELTLFTAVFKWS
ncbi:MAG: hypothetical protein HY447_04535 [Candidatus Omnitrophica bacterium]|nr:hypothetical protein [Candidatus Omnitrophota bacterium]